MFDNIIQRVATEIAKAAPAPTVTPVTEAQLQAAQNTGYGNSAGLTRNPLWANVPFTPGQPIIPGAINPVRDDGRPDPRRYEYQVAQNINITPTRLVPFSTLRAAGDQIDILRRCVEVLKNKMVGLDWDIVLSEGAAEKVMSDTGETSFNRAMAIAKTSFSDDINRIKQFWEVPDVSNGLIFADWLNMALEDILVLDAWSVWPQKTVGGDLKGLQILDGSTIKPLIDDRGMRPQAPFPAFQQILYGFPRSEFSAPEEEVEADGEFSSDEMAYMIRNRRTNTVYGYSPVERSLPIADIYLRRQQWLRAEYTDGVIPELLFKSDGAFTPDQLRAYENVLNDYLSGQTEQRKRANIIPQGLDPVQMDGYGEKFKSDFDDFLITQICGHFGVLPSEIGMVPKSGLGGSGHQDGQASSSEVIGLIPLSQWVGKMLSQLSYVFLGMPRELEFKFMPSGRNNELALAQTTDILVKDGVYTRNEARAKMGLPLLDAVEADQPIIETSAGTFIITPEGLQPLTADNGTGENEEGAPDTVDEGSPVEELPNEEAPVEETPVVEDDKTPDNVDDEAKKFVEARDEIRKFKKWLRKSPNKPFNFEHVPATYAETLNKFVAVEDFEGARWFADRWL